MYCHGSVVQLWTSLVLLVRNHLYSNWLRSHLWDPGFDYHFHSLEGGDEDELSRAFMKVFEAGQEVSTLAILKNFIPILRHIVSVDQLTLLSTA